MSTEFSSEPDRAAVIAGLRKLADFLEANPGVPVNGDFQRITFATAPGASPGEVAAAVAEVERIAEILGVPALRWGAHHAAVRYFGAVKYEAAACDVYKPNRKRVAA